MFYSSRLALQELKRRNNEYQIKSVRNVSFSSDCALFFSKTGVRIREGKIKKIKDLTEREHRRRRKNWKHSQKKAMTDSSNIPN